MSSSIEEGLCKCYRIDMRFPRPKYFHLRISLIRLFSVFVLVVTILLTFLSYLLPRVSKQPFGFRALRTGEADIYIFLTPGKFSSMAYTPWDRKWYPDLSVPIWAAFLAVEVVAVTLLFMHKKFFRPWRPTRRAHVCLCGYDLTGNRSGICPECGRQIEGS